MKGSAVAWLTPLAARLLLSSVFVYSGWMKLTVGTGRAASAIAGRGFPFATAGAYTSGAFELASALAIAVGLRVRPVALAVLGYLVLVTVVFHWPAAARGDHGQALQVLKNAGLAGGYLLLWHHGPGAASVDRG